MSKDETELPERLSAAGATDLERRLLRAASREQPSRELSERMALGIGVSASVPGSALDQGVQTRAAAEKAAAATHTGMPWVVGALIAAAVAGAVVASSPRANRPASPTAVSSVPLAPGVPSTAAPSLALPRADTPTTAGTELAAKEPLPIAPARGRRGMAPSELAKQIAMVDAARTALASGGTERALKIVGDYQTQYPSGMFRPEAAAVKIEALARLGRIAEARALAQRFVGLYGSGPLADRVARLAGPPQP